jgi:hypothetical protein
MIEVFVVGNLISLYFYTKYIQKKLSTDGKFERKEFILANIYYFSYTMIIVLISVYLMQLVSYCLMFIRSTESPDSVVNIFMKHAMVAKFMSRFLTNITKVMAYSFSIHGFFTLLFMVGNRFKPITDEYRVKFEYYLLNSISLITTCVTIFYL